MESNIDQRGSRTHERTAGRWSAVGLSALVAATLAVAPVAALSSTDTGPNTTTAPYVLPVADGAAITSLLTVGEGAASNGYEMVGIPDGLGAFRQGANLVVYMNHELRNNVGIARRHGEAGAFVSRLVIDPTTLRVKEGSDWIDPGVRYWDYGRDGYVTSGALFADGAAQLRAFGRFCSGTLSDPDLFYNPTTKAGYKGQLYFANEENGDNGRVFAVEKDGQATQLPRLGLFSWENTVPAPNQSDTTVVMGQEDGPRDGSQLWVYVGTKQRNGPAVDKAGLTNGLDYVFDAVDESVSTDAQWRTTYGTTAARVDLAAIEWDATGAAQNSQAKGEGLNLNRIEDGHFDPNHPNDYYFLTTEGGATSGSGLDARDGGGLWRLRFDDIDHPFAGASLQLLLDGSESLGAGEPGMNKPDNLGIDTHGNLMIQEDPGNNNSLARIVAYRIADGALGVVARFDASLFGAASVGTDAHLTIDEESSGIIDVEPILGAGSFLFDAQIHTSKGLPLGIGPGTVQELVERGQLLVLKVADWAAVYDDLD